MYRALTLKVLNREIDPRNPKEIIELLENTSIDFKNNTIYLDGKNVNQEIRDNKVSKNVSYIAAIAEVREIMVKMQQNMAKSKNIIMDGRDICTVVLPNAKYKFFVTASVQERALRRYKDLIKDSKDEISLEEIEKEISKRDKLDSNRQVGPLVKKEDTILVDNTNQTIKETVDTIVSIVRGR